MWGLEGKNLVRAGATEAADLRTSHSSLPKSDLGVEGPQSFFPSAFPSSAGASIG